MTRVLHLAPVDVDFETHRALGALGAGGLLGGEFDARTARMGRGGDWRGLPSAAWGLRRTNPADVVHAWGPRALTAAALAGVGRIVYSPMGAASPRAVNWLRAVSGHRDVHAVCPTVTIRRAMLGAGVEPARCHLIRPGVDFAKVKRRRDPALRAALGFAPGDEVLFAVGESTRAAGHALAAWALGLLHRLHPQTRLLLWGRGDHADAVERFAGQMLVGNAVRLAEQRLGRTVELEELFPAADTLLVTAGEIVPTLPVAVAMAAALPIVATVSSTIGELLEDRHTALLAPPHAPRLLAQRILEMRDRKDLQWSTADMARVEAYEFFAQSRFVNQHRQLYRQVAAGGPVEIPEIGPGAGLRFHGRG